MFKKYVGEKLSLIKTPSKKKKASICHQFLITHVVEGAAAGWRDLEKAWVDEGSEGRGRLVFGHGVAL